MADLRPGWKRVKFGEVVCQIKDRVPSAEESGLIHYVRGEDFDPGGIKLWRRSEIGDGQHGPAFHMRFRAGDVLYVSRNPRLRKAAVADFSGICANTTYVCRANTEHLLQELLPFVMQTESFTEFAKRHQRGSTNFYVNWSDLAPYEFALPPLEEQRRIAGMLKSLLNVVSTLETLASSADLVAHAAVDECVAKWQSRPLGEVATFVTSGSRGWAAHYAETGDLFIRVTNLQPKSVRLDLDDRKFVQPPEGAEGTRTLVRPGDVLVAVTGEYLGMVALAPADIGRAYVNQHVAIVRIDQTRASPEFVAFALTGSAAQQAVWSKNDGGTKPGMTLGQVRALPIPDAALNEQLAWARHLQDIESQRERSRVRLAEARHIFSSALNGEFS